MKNLVLIGMPGSGKSSVGRRLAKKLRMPMIDIDTLLEEGEGRSISDIFATEGESGFRDHETRYVLQAAARDGTIIATGGGVILRPENMAALEKNGIILFLDRHPKDILRGTNLADRPLVRSQHDKLWELYRQRLALYRHYAHHRVRNKGRLKHVVLLIANLYNRWPK